MHSPRMHWCSIAACRTATENTRLASACTPLSSIRRSSRRDPWGVCLAPPNRRRNLIKAVTIQGWYPARGTSLPRGPRPRTDIVDCYVRHCADFLPNSRELSSQPQRGACGLGCIRMHAPVCTASTLSPCAPIKFCDQVSLPPHRQRPTGVPSSTLLDNAPSHRSPHLRLQFCVRIESSEET